MSTLKINTVNAKHFTGSTIQGEFKKCGYITLTFNVMSYGIRCIDVSGYSINSDLSYYKTPKNIKQFRANDNFNTRILNGLEEDNKNLLTSYL